MFKAYHYRIYPNIKQQALISDHINAVRFIYNLALDTKLTAYKFNKVNLSSFQLIKQLPDLKAYCTWLKDINSQSLQASIKNLDTAFTKFYTKLNQFPKFKSKKTAKQSFHIPQNVTLKDNKLIIPKFKDGIPIKLHRQIKGIIKSATISKTSTNKFYVSILCDTPDKPKLKPEINVNNTIGIDLGIKDFLITSKGDKINNPKYLRKSESKLRYVQSKYSKNKGKRTKKKLNLIHEKISNQRKDFLHKVSTKLIRENQTISLETLNVKGMLKNHKLSKSISDVSWGKFIDMLKYKAEWYGVNIIKIDRFAPSSKTCSNCGNINKELKLKDREWRCINCGTHHDRDINAAINIKTMGLTSILSGTDRQNRNELPLLKGVLTYEAHDISYAVDG